MSSTFDEDFDYNFLNEDSVTINRVENGYVLEILGETFVAKEGEEVLNILRNEFIEMED